MNHHFRDHSVCFMYYIIVICPESISQEIDSGHSASPVVCHRTTSILSQRPPLIVSCHLRWRSGPCRLGHRGVEGGNWLADWRHQSWENALSLVSEKMTDSECLRGWQTRAPRGGWMERAKMAKDMPERGQQTRSGKLCHHQNYLRAERASEVMVELQF